VAVVRRISRDSVHRALETVGLLDDAHRRVRTFSGGMLQRLALGAALLADTPVLLFDEPSASLDEEGQEAFVEIVGRLRREGRTLVLASHRPDEVHALTDRVIHLDRGRTRSATLQERGSRVLAFAPLAERR
jgi:ABC-type multidrug transport system ATPase subunit